MKTILHFSAALAGLTLGVLPCPAETPAPQASTPAPSATLETDEQGLQTRSFRVPRGFFPPAGGRTSGSTSTSRTRVAPDPRTILTQLGVEFNSKKSLVSFNSKTSVLTVTNTPEQLDNVELVLQSRFYEPVRQGHVHLEVFSMPPPVARKALIVYPKEAALYAWLEAELARPEGSVKLERHLITVVRGGQKAKTEGIDEIPYPTEFDPGQIPQSISLPVAATGTATANGNATFAPWPRTGITPQSFAFRNAGDTFEVELTFPDDGKTVDLNLAAETIRRAGIVKFGLMEEVYQPVFETQRCAAQVSNLIGQPSLVSSFSPPLNTGVLGANEEDRTWLLFVTVKPVE